MYKPLVEAQENVPPVPVIATVLKLGDSRLFETTVVPEGMFVPVTVWPAPIKTFVSDMVTDVVLFM